MAVRLHEHQLKALDKLSNGKILCGGVGTGKSRVAIAYYIREVCGASFKINGKGENLPMTRPRDIFIITTAKKRDHFDWQKEAAHFGMSNQEDASLYPVTMIVDSWNNIQKYKNVYGAFFIFDEQRLVGSGAWVKAFLNISRKNQWILLSATPGDTWLDYIPVFVANGYYRTRTDFKRRHVVYNHYSKFPKVDHYVEVGRLNRLRKEILVDMPYDRHTTRHSEWLPAHFDAELQKLILTTRWNPFEDKPIRNVTELISLLRRLTNSDPSRKDILVKMLEKHPRLIVWYNFDYELEIFRDMRDLFEAMEVEMAEWNGHRHEQIPTGEKWVYFVQYTAGAEGWNCVVTDTMLFYSLNYSYRLTEQAKGRIDRLNTPYKDLYYYSIRSGSQIDRAILKALREKRTFNEKEFMHD